MSRPLLPLLALLGACAPDPTDLQTQIDALEATVHAQQEVIDQLLPGQAAPPPGPAEVAWLASQLIQSHGFLTQAAAAPFNTRLSALETASAAHEVRLGLAESELGAASLAVAEHESRLSTEELATSTIDARLDAQDAATAALGVRVLAVETGSTVDLGLLTSRVTAVEYAQVDQALQLAALESSVSDIEASVASLPPPPVVVSTANHRNVEAVPGQHVQVGETIMLSSAYDNLEVDDLQINGGGFIGTSPTIKLEMGRDVTFTNVSFEDLDLDGYRITFINCQFTGDIIFPDDATIIGGRMTNVLQSTNIRIESIQGTEISDSTLPRVERITNATIQDSTIGGNVSNSTQLTHLVGSEVGDSLIYPSRGATISGNHVSDSTILIGPTHWGYMTVTGNTIDGIHATRAEAIFIDSTSSWWGQVSIVGNSFMGSSTVPTQIRVTGNATGSYQGLSIIGNILMRGTTAITQTSNVYTIVTNNGYRGNTLGVAGTGTMTVANNYPM